MKYEPSTILTKKQISTTSFIFGKYPILLKYLAAVDSAEIHYQAVHQYLKKLHIIFWTECQLVAYVFVAKYDSEQEPKTHGLFDSFSETA